MEEIRVVELFAGVGGFHQGLKEASSRFHVVWSNQWEPSTKVQHASEIYQKRFGSENHCNEDISKVPMSLIPEHDMLVGGFPCQDYSVAKTLNQAAGIVGKKGVLWWEIYRIVNEKRPAIIFLENVDRLLKSPAGQRGRDFAIMLASLSDLGYIVEWRVINAADYGMPQRRRRIFILAYRESSKIFNLIRKNKPFEWLTESGVFAQTFPIQPAHYWRILKLDGELSDISKAFNLFHANQPHLFETAPRAKQTDGQTPFENSGIIIERNVFTIRTEPQYDGTSQTLGDIILQNGAVPPEYYIPEEQRGRWEYLKGSKNERRTNKSSGFEYQYNEGPMNFPDPLNKPSRTIITAEGGASPSRFKHVIRTADGRLRRLTPVELERLNMFPDNHTAGVSDIKRAFFMGNALVVGLVRKVGENIASRV